MNLATDRTLVLSAYLFAVGTAAITLALPIVSDWHPLMQILLADVVATIAVFAFSVFTGNSSVYDPYWSVAPVFIAGWFIYIAQDANTARQVIVTLVVLLWAVRLTGNWLFGWRGLGHEDWRYVNLRQQAGALWWPLSLAGIHLFPTLIVFIGCISLYPVLVTGNQPLGWIDAGAALVGLLSVLLEYVADARLHRFRAERATSSELLTDGVWRWCRHPNYLGEIGFWMSLFLFAAAAGGGYLMLAAAGPAAMIALFTGVSIPMIEKKLLQDKPGYADYQARSFALLPIPLRRKTETSSRIP